MAGMLLLLTTLCALAAPVYGWEIDGTATVTSIIDGDTFDCAPTGRIRLADIDSPEYYEAGYQEATDYLTSLISGQTVYLDIDDLYGTDTYGRWVAVVYVRSSLTQLRNVNQAMLDAGRASVWEYDNEFSPSTWSAYVFYPVDAPPPTVTASASTLEGVAPLEVHFTSSAAGGIPPYTYAWTFGDGGAASVPEVSHTFRTGGSFPVTLRVTDAALRSGSQTLSIAVDPPLTAAASADRLGGVKPLTVNFTAGASGGVVPYTYAWSFGDGATSAEQNPGHTYAMEGNFTATLRVTDARNLTDVRTIQISVTAPDPPASPTEPAAPAGTSGEVVAGAAVVLAGAAAAGFAWFRRRRGRR